MRVRKLIIEKRIKILSANNNEDKDYEGHVFVLKNDNSFIDWLNGKPNSYTRDLSDFVYESISPEYSTSGRFSNNYSKNTKEAVEARLVDTLLTQRGELSFAGTELAYYGAPSWFKKRQADVDLLLTELILQIPGVNRINTFESNVDEKLAYKCRVEIITEEGDTLWQTIEI